MQYRRIRVSGACYFFTVNLANRHNGILIQEITALRQAFAATKMQYPFKIDAYSILPDHLHLMMTLPDNDSDYSLRWRMIKGIFSRQIQKTTPGIASHIKKRERGIWQKRFWEHLIRNDYDFEQHLNYIHYNPVKHAYVKKASDWEYSSIHHYIKKGIIPDDWAWNDTSNQSTAYGE